MRLKLLNKVTTCREGPQSLSYHKQSLGKDGLVFADSCFIKYVHCTFYKQTLKKCDQLASRFATCMYDPYTSTHTIITLTAKKRDQLTPRFGTCMYDPYTSTHTIITVTTKKRDPQIWDLYV